MDGLLDAQSFLGEQIQNSLRNFRKDSASRQTTSQYFTTRLDSLKGHWDEFQANHQQLLELERQHDDNDYFTKDYYATIEKLYIQFKEELTQGLEGLGASISQQDTQQSDFRTSTEDGKKEVPSKNEQHKQTPSSEMSEDHQAELIRKVRRQQRSMASLARVLQEYKDKAPKTHSRVYYELKIQMINKSLDEITEIDRQIWEETTEPPLNYTRELYDHLYDWVHETLVELHENLDTRGTETHNTQQPHSQIKLPRVTLPVFDGDYTKWTQFHDLFYQMIHMKPISQMEKMFYLTSNLSGEARALVKHLPLSEANYTTSWKILNNRYNNQRLLCTALLNKLWDQPGTQGQSARSIKHLHDVTNECIFALKNIGVSTSNWDPILIHLLIKKLDKTTHALFGDSLDSPRAPPTMRALLDFLEKRFQTLEKNHTHQDKDPTGDQQRIHNLL